MTLEYELGYLLGKEAARTGESEASLKERLGELLTASNGNQPATKKTPRQATKYFVEGATQTEAGKAKNKRHQKVLALNDKLVPPEKIAKLTGYDGVAGVYYVLSKYGVARKAPKHPGVKLG